MSRIRIPAAWMRGGTSKGLFLLAADLPDEPAARDALLLRAIGSPDPYGKQIDGLGGATSSTSKVVIVAPSARPDCDVDYLFGQVPVGGTAIDWSGNCGNLSAAVGPFAIERGLVACPGTAVRRCASGRPTSASASSPMCRSAAARYARKATSCSTGWPLPRRRSTWSSSPRRRGAVPGGRLPHPARSGRTGAGRGHADRRGDPAGAGRGHRAGRRLQCLAGAAQPRHRAAGALRGAAHCRRAGDGPGGFERRGRGARPHPKLALLAPPQSHLAADGRRVDAAAQDLTVRVLSMGVVHHAIPGTAAIGPAAAASIPGTLAARQLQGATTGLLRIGHPSGRVEVGVRTRHHEGEWRLESATMTRSARLLMDGWVSVPGLTA